MKKYLLLFIVSMISISSFSSVTPGPWDNPLYKSKAFTDPYVRIYAAYDLDYGNYYHRVKVDVEFDQTVGVPYYAVIRVYGDFYSTNEWYRDYTIYLSGWQWRKSEEFPLLWNEEVYTEVTELLDYGPQ